eukprot:SAG31_NODE_12463_length_939_cov_7.576190_1_plen_87_part_00
MCPFSPTNYLPGSTSVLLGFNEMRALNLDLQVSQLHAPQGAKLLHTREREDGKLVFGHHRRAPSTKATQVQAEELRGRHLDGGMNY